MALTTRSIARVRALSVELVWLRLRHQPQSDLSKWNRALVGQAKSRGS